MAPVVHDLARTPHLTGPDHVAAANLPTVDPHLLGQPIERAFHRELRLVRAEAAERTTHRVVRAGRDRVDVDVRNAIRTAGVSGRAFEHLRTDRRIRAAVTDHARPECGETTIGVTARVVLHTNRVTFGVHEQRLLPGERALDRLLQEPRGERRVRLVAHVLFAAEGPTIGHELDGYIHVPSQRKGLPISTQPCRKSW